MTRPIHRVEDFETIGPFVLLVRFDDGTEQRMDFRPGLERQLLGPLQHPRVFNAAVLDTEAGLWYGRTVPTSIQQRCTTDHSFVSISFDRMARA